MTSRYRRKAVSQILQVQSLTKDASKPHPLPDDVDDVTSAPFSNHRNEAGSQEKSNESKILRCSSGPIITATDTVLSDSTFQSCSGLSTDGSSVMSWGFDEYDQATTHLVQQLFKQIDELLYEEKTGELTKGLHEEWQEWRSCFPHLRLCGEQVVIPTDDGYSWYSISPSKSSHSPDVSHAQEQDFTELNIFGMKVPLRTTSEEAIFTKTTSGISSMEGVEGEESSSDVNVSEGIIEEYLAFDCRNMEEELYERNLAFSFGALKMGRPPISPFYCRKHALLAYLFDDVWREVVSCMDDLIRKHWEESVSDAEKSDTFLETTKVESLSPFQQFEPLPLALPRMPLSKMHPTIPNLENRSQAASTGHQWNLNSIMTIQGIPLQHRNLSLVDKNQDLDDMPQLRPTSGAVIPSRPWLGCPQEQSTSSLSHSAQATRRRNPPRILHPISNTSFSRSGTPRMDEVVRGTRLVTANDQLSASPIPFSRNHPLPPIGTDLAHSSTSGLQRQMPDTQSRTIMDASSQRLTRRGSPGTDSVRIGVMGISLGRSSSYMNSSSHHPRGHATNDEEEKEDHPSLGLPSHGSLRSHSRGGPLTRSRQGM